MKQDEQAIIIRILDGDEQLYEVLIERYKEGLYRHCFKFVRDEDWAEDIAQETFIRAYTHLETYDHSYRFSTWLYKIATNKALEQLRKKQSLPLDEEMQIISSLADTDQLAKDNELHQLVDMLPENHKKVVAMHYWQGKSYLEIAKEMDASIGSVKSWMSRAKKQLKERL